MQIIFLRHGQYEVTRTRPRKDGPLTERGRLMTTHAGRWLKRRGLRPTHLARTPTERTTETARRALAELDLDADALLVRERSIPRDLPRWNAFADDLREQLGDEAVVLVVGHDPAQSLLRSRMGLPSHIGKRHHAVTAVLEQVQGEWTVLDWWEGVKASDTIVPDRSDRPGGDALSGTGSTVRAA